MNEREEAEARERERLEKERARQAEIRRMKELKVLHCSVANLVQSMSHVATYVLCSSESRFTSMQKTNIRKWRLEETAKRLEERKKQGCLLQETSVDTVYGVSRGYRVCYCVVRKLGPMQSTLCVLILSCVVRLRGSRKC